ncbi:hypothetical protein ACHAW5_007561 [Stephanodiscus triporus]|uniref:Uncharacterized protein n=1 Tax=Stephanodiscus triporus TaxID=2934178 RepID=A0ABD3NI03_9STRA
MVAKNLMAIIFNNVTMLTIDDTPRHYSIACRCSICNTVSERYKIRGGNKSGILNRVKHKKVKQKVR